MRPAHRALALTCALILSIYLSPLARCAVVTPADLYQQALTADSNFSYVGRQFITVYRDDGRSVSYVTEVTHRAPDDFKIVYQAPLRDSGRTIIEDDKEQWTFLPRTSTIVHSQGLMPLTRKQASSKYALLKRNYFLKLDSATTKIADRKTFKLLITPQNATGRVVKLWIDPDTGLVLRKEQYHADGALDTVMYFSELSLVKTLNDKQFSIATYKKGSRPVETAYPDETVIKRGDVARYFGQHVFVPEELGGFQLQSLTMMRARKGGSLHLRYSDGLVSLSLFEARRTSRKTSNVTHSIMIRLSKGRTAHAIQRYSYDLLNWDTGQYNFTLVGDMRLNILKQLAESCGSD